MVAEVGVSSSSSSKIKSRTRMVVATMRIERYYASLKEEVSPLSPAAEILLDKQDYIGFFKSCGPNYVRGIRRAQELTAVFKFHSSSRELATEFASTLKAKSKAPAGPSVSAGASAKAKFSSINNSLEIVINGYGLGLNQDGSQTLVATSLDEYNKVMEFAFKSFTQNEDSSNIGMVYGIEVVPWVDNTAFQVAAKILDEDINIPVARSLIPKATNPSDITAVFVNDSNTRALFQCKKTDYKMDKYGYCCLENDLYDPTNTDYAPEDTNFTESSRVCRPKSILDKSVAKNNMASNGEFVARLDSIVRYRLNQLFTLEKCISAVRAIPDRYQYNILKSQDVVKYDKSIDLKFTVAELRMALDPKDNFGFVTHMSRELDEFIDMYYQPCVAALFGINIDADTDDTSSDTSPEYFMAYPWYSHDECNHLSCLADNMRWDRESDGCVPSLMTGSSSRNYDGDDCSFDPDKFDTVEACKYDTTVLNEYRENAIGCWKPDTVPIYLMDHFCLPQITGVEADQDIIDDLKIGMTNCTTGPTRRRRLDASEPAVTWSQRDSY